MIRCQVFLCYTYAVIIALTIIAMALAAQPPQSPQEKGIPKSQGTKNAPTTENANNTQKPSQPHPQDTVTAAQPSANTNQSSANSETENVQVQRRIEIFTGVLAGVGALQLVVMFLTWLVYKRQAGEMRRSRHEMRRQRHVMFGQYKAMRDQIAQMEQAGKQTAELIKQASTQSGLLALAGTHTETLAAQAVKQSSLTQRQLDLANRPWICIDSVKPVTDLTFKDSGEAVIFFAYQIRNVGHSVAQHLQPWIEPIITGIHNPVEVMARISAQLKKPIDSAFDHGKLIFPSQIIVDTYPVLIRKEVVDDAIANSPFKEQGDKQVPCFGLELFVCFDYQSTLDPTIHHQTQSMFMLSRADPRGLAMGTFFPSQRVYRVNEISVGYKGYGAHAD